MHIHRYRIKLKSNKEKIVPNGGIHDAYVIDRRRKNIMNSCGSQTDRQMDKVVH